MLSESGDKQKKIVDNVDKSVYNCFLLKNRQKMVCINRVHGQWEYCG